jgi:hypothetical protein
MKKFNFDRDSSIWYLITTAISILSVIIIWYIVFRLWMN